MMTTKQALVEKCRREARARGEGRRDCPYGAQETIAREAWLEGYRAQKQLQFHTAYNAEGENP